MENITKKEFELEEVFNEVERITSVSIDEILAKEDIWKCDICNCDCNCHPCEHTVIINQNA